MDQQERLVKMWHTHEGIKNICAQKNYIDISRHSQNSQYPKDKILSLGYFKYARNVSTYQTFDM